MHNIRDCHIKSLALKNFRNYDSLNINFDAKPYIIYGDNGVGKTNILEAISLLSAGRGLRGVVLHELVQTNSTNSFIESSICNFAGNFNLSLSVEQDNDTQLYKKQYFLDGNAIKGKALIPYYLDCIWLTPQMDNFFLQDNTHKRKFIDKLIFHFDKSHLSRLNEADKLIRERNNLLAYNNNTWLNLVEEKLVENSVPIIMSRLYFIEQLNNIIKTYNYPVSLSFEGFIEELIQAHTYALTVENMLKKAFKDNRKNDTLSLHTSVGAHKSKLTAFNIKEQTSAEHASTGEQKMMLISIILAFTELLKQKKSSPQPILLMDEINVHLDNNNTTYIVEKLLSFNLQMFITTTNKSFYNNFKNEFNFFNPKTNLV